MTRSDRLIAELQTQLAGHEVVVFIGAGVSAAATGGMKASTWKGLLEDGIDYGKSSTHYDWAAVEKSLSNAFDTEDFIDVADQITLGLGGKSVKYREWLKSSLGALHPTKDGRRLIQALVELDNALVTTNYDHLLEDVSGYDAFDWSQFHDIGEVIRNRRTGIVHLHGHYTVPENVVLDHASYDALIRSQPFIQLRDALTTLRSFLFVGYGEGVKDPNFRRWRDWMEISSSELLMPSYRLCLESEFDSLAREHRRDNNLYLLPYGKEHDGLLPFVQELAPIQAATGPLVIKISMPTSTTVLGHEVAVSGSVSGLRAGTDLWIVKEVSSMSFHPDAGPLYTDGKIWSGTAYLGRKGVKIGSPTHHLVHIVAAKRQTSAAYRRYIDRCQQTNSWPGLPSLYGGEIVATLALIRTA